MFFEGFLKQIPGFDGEKTSVVQADPAMKVRPPEGKVFLVLMAEILGRGLARTRTQRLG